MLLSAVAFVVPADAAELPLQAAAGSAASHGADVVQPVVATVARAPEAVEQAASVVVVASAQDPVEQVVAAVVDPVARTISPVDKVATATPAPQDGAVHVDGAGGDDAGLGVADVGVSSVAAAQPVKPAGAASTDDMSARSVQANAKPAADTTTLVVAVADDEPMEFGTTRTAVIEDAGAGAGAGEGASALLRVRAAVAASLGSPGASMVMAAASVGPALGSFAAWSSDDVLWMSFLLTGAQTLLAFRSRLLERSIERPG